jgi:hypothetical protein
VTSQDFSSTSLDHTSRAPDSPFKMPQQSESHHMKALAEALLRPWPEQKWFALESYKPPDNLALHGARVSLRL